MHRPSIAMLSCALILAACSSEKPRELTLSDIRFPDPEREAIVENGIAHVVAYDTGFLFHKYPGMRSAFGRINHRWDKDTDFFWGLEMTRSLYDKNGNRTYFWRNNGMVLMAGCDNYPHTIFDSLGKPIYDWLVEPRNVIDTTTYFLKKPDKLLAVTYRRHRDEYGLDTTEYLIDTKGRPKMRTHLSGYPDDTGWVYSETDTSWYTYQDDKLVHSIWHYHDPGDSTADEHFTASYFYRNGRLDSCYTSLQYPNDKYEVRGGRRDFIKYDKRGLPLRGILFDSIHVFYKFKKHGDPTIPDYRGW